MPQEREPAEDQALFKAIENRTSSGVLAGYPVKSRTVVAVGRSCGINAARRPNQLVPA